MALKTKSIRAKAEKEDGLRICIMGTYNPSQHKDYKKIDARWQSLSPSPQLLENFKDGLSWPAYVEIFTEEVLGPQSLMIQSLAQFALKQDVTILCYDDKPNKCHRRLIALACKMYEPDLEIILE